MIWNGVLFISLAVGVLAHNDMTYDQRTVFRDMFKSQCSANHTDDALVGRAVDDFMICFNALVDVDTMKEELQAAKPKGVLDEVFKKYCAKTPQLKTCIHTLVSTLTPCFEASGRDTVNTVNNATSQLLEFVCYKQGDRIALFIAEKGIECFQEKVDDLIECTKDLQETERSLTLNEQCEKFDELTECMVKVLEECSTPTPANMFEALFKYIRKASPCKSIVKT